MVSPLCLVCGSTDHCQTLVFRPVRDIAMLLTRTSINQTNKQKKKKNADNIATATTFTNSDGGKRFTAVWKSICYKSIQRHLAKFCNKCSLQNTFYFITKVLKHIHRRTVRINHSLFMNSIVRVKQTL